MLEKILFWLVRKIGKSQIFVFIKPTFNEGGNLEGELIFANTLLRFSKRKKFRGLKDLRNMSGYLRRTISVYAPRSVAMQCESCITYFGEITSKSTDEDLEEIARKMNEEMVFIKFAENNVNLPWERLHLIY